MLYFPVMMRGSKVPDPTPRPQDLQPEPPPPDKSSPSFLGFLRAYAVALVNGAALLYILVRIVIAAVRRLWDFH